jgi:hypothetical protein
MRVRNKLRPIEIIFPSTGDAAAFLQLPQAKKALPSNVPGQIGTVLAGRGDQSPQQGISRPFLAISKLAPQISV